MHFLAYSPCPHVCFYTKPKLFEAALDCVKSRVQPALMFATVSQSELYDMAITEQMNALYYAPCGGRA